MQSKGRFKKIACEITCKISQQILNFSCCSSDSIISSKFGTGTKRHASLCRVLTKVQVSVPEFHNYQTIQTKGIWDVFRELKWL